MISGSCLCKSSCWEMHSPVAKTRHYHFSIYFTVHGAPFATYLSADSKQFHFTSGTDEVTEQFSPHLTCEFCSICGSAMPMTLAAVRPSPPAVLVIIRHTLNHTFFRGF